MRVGPTCVRNLRGLGVNVLWGPQMFKPRGFIGLLDSGVHTYYIHRRI